MFSEIGNLSQHWHVIGLASEVKAGQSLKRKIYGEGLLIWRDKAGQLHSILDCCAHKRTPLIVKDYKNNSIVCPYHGWEYDKAGALTHVPSSPDHCDKLKCTLPTFTVIESDGFLWIYLADGPPANAIPSLDEFSGRAWSRTFQTMSFETTDELLIENFMDPTHTALVHDGLIRSSKNAADHEMSLTTHSTGVKVDFPEQEESVGPGARLLFGSSMKVRHTDEFLLPNLVKVTYWINGEAKFLALIACTPCERIEDADETNTPCTQAFVQLRYRFGWLNVFAKMALPLLGRKVLKQDFDITQSQFLNQQTFAGQKEHWVASDAVAKKISTVRRQTIDGVAEDQKSRSTQTLNLRF